MPGLQQGAQVPVMPEQSRCSVGECQRPARLSEHDGAIFAYCPVHAVGTPIGRDDEFQLTTQPHNPDSKESKIMDMSTQFSADYFTAARIHQPKLVTIAAVVIAKVGDDEKPVVRFVGEQQALALNKTNNNTMMQLYGPDSVGWVGKQVCLYSTTTAYGGKTVPCIRVRQPQEQPPWAGQQVQPMPQPMQQQPVAARQVQPVPQQVYQQMQPPVVQQPAQPIQAPQPDYPLDA